MVVLVVDQDVALHLLADLDRGELLLDLDGLRDHLARVGLDHHQLRHVQLHYQTHLLEARPDAVEVLQRQYDVVLQLLQTEVLVLLADLRVRRAQHLLHLVELLQQLAAGAQHLRRKDVPS